jgi:hypothetical protein
VAGLLRRVLARRAWPASQPCCTSGWLLCTLLADPTQEMYGLQIGADTGLPSGTIHPILARLENEYGWVTSRWEDIKPEDEGGPGGAATS